MPSNIVLQNASGAFLKNGDNYLLIKRSENREIAPGFWSCVGGHMEGNEINNPLETCLREIKEETGITEDHIFNLHLRYIIIRRYRNIIMQSYIYFGETDKNEYINTAEGTLHWIHEEELYKKKYTRTYAEMIKHYLQNKEVLSEKLVLGVAEKKLGQLEMNWSVLEDFE